MLKDKGDYTRGDIMRILVFGAIGYVGAHVYQQWAADPQAAVVGTCSKVRRARGLVAVDLEPDQEVRDLLRAVKPDVVIWCAKAHEDHEEEMQGAGLAAVVQEVGQTARLIFLSSDGVLPGKSGHYDERTEPQYRVGSMALDRYINAKIDAERRIQTRASDFCIVRSGPVFGRNVHGQWDDRTGRVLDTLARGERMRQPKNLIRTYADVSDLAASVTELSRLSLQGILHVGATVPASHYDYAITLAERWNYSATLIEGFVIDPEDAKQRQVRLNTSMDTKRASNALKRGFRNISEALACGPSYTTG